MVDPWVDAVVFAIREATRLKRQRDRLLVELVALRARRLAEERFFRELGELLVEAALRRARREGNTVGNTTAK